MAAASVLAQGSTPPKRDFSKYLHRPLVRPLKEQVAKAKEWLIAGEARCAHLVTFVPPKDLDSKMAIVPGERYLGAAKTVPAPMQVCPDDVRELPDVNRR